MEKIKYTHLLECRHCVSAGHCRTYYMRCNVIGETEKSIKLEIIGERYWKGFENKRRIRYLPKNESWRLLKELEDETHND